eukprot:TRINITY_DN4746_c0_g1_i1.p1 TRINITY_DN4746_c0_g1~~TRINITY_DN4746_c0_g1_i1.p1  ORF type:complete len:294 (+),score=74.38 TRINITY_DN4746_c0_g1_i1:35-916(+)
MRSRRSQPLACDSCYHKQAFKNVPQSESSDVCEIDDPTMHTIIDAMLDNSGKWRTSGMNGSGTNCAKLRSAPLLAAGQQACAVVRVLTERLRAKEHPQIELLELRHVDLSQVAPGALAALWDAVLECLSSLVTLDLEHCSLGDAGLAGLLAAVRSRGPAVRLRFLYLAGNNLSARGLRLLHDGLFGSDGKCSVLGQQVQGIGLTNNHLLQCECAGAGEAVKMLVRILHGCPALRIVHLNYVGLSDAGAAALLLGGLAKQGPLLLEQVFLKQNDGIASWAQQHPGACPRWAVLQ